MAHAGPGHELTSAYGVTAAAACGCSPWDEPPLAYRIRHTACMPMQTKRVYT